MKKYNTCVFIFLLLHIINLKAQPTDSCQGNTWLKLWGAPGSIERGVTLCPSSDAAIYATATTPDSAIILKLDLNGNIIWARSFDFFPGYDKITHLYLDSDGMLIGCGRSGTSFSGGSNSFLFKYNPQKDSVHWRYQPAFFTVNSRFVGGIKEKTIGGNYYISFLSLVGPGDGVIIEIDRQTGQSIPGKSWRYNFGGGNFTPLFITNGPYLYAVGGSSTSPGGPQRQALICIDTMTGQVQWSQLNHIPINEDGRLWGEDAIRDNNNLVSVYYGNNQSNSLSPSFIFLQKSTLNGERIWLKKYDLPTFSSEGATEIVRVSDGYVIFGSLRIVPTVKNGLFIFKTDFDGNVIWTRLFHYSGGDYTYTIERDQEFLEMDGFLYFIGFSKDNLGGDDILIGKINSEGLVDDSCAYITSIPIETFDITDAVVEHPPVAFQNLAIETLVPLPSSMAKDIPFIPTQTLCERICNTSDSIIACDIKENGCVKFELLKISIDNEGNKHYNVRFTNYCNGQYLDYLAIQVPQGTVAVYPLNGSTYLTPGGRSYAVRNPNSSPFYSIRFRMQGAGITGGQSDVFEYALIGQTEPEYINIFARLSPGPSYEAHLNTYNCPIIMMQDAQNRISITMNRMALITPNPTTDYLHVSIPESGNGKWQIYSITNRKLDSGLWEGSNSLTIPVQNLPQGVYFIQLNTDEDHIDSQLFIKIN